MATTKMGQELIAGLKEALSHERGEIKLRSYTLEIPEPARRWRKEQIADLRKNRFGVSQPVFAAFLSVKVSTIRAWEQGLKSPSGAASRLLELASMDPEIFRCLIGMDTGVVSDDKRVAKYKAAFAPHSKFLQGRAKIFSRTGRKK